MPKLKEKPCGTNYGNRHHPALNYQKTFVKAYGKHHPPINAYTFTSYNIYILACTIYTYIHPAYTIHPSI